MAAAVARVIAPAPGRPLGPLLQAAGRREVAWEPVDLGGAFAVARGDKPAA